MSPDDASDAHHADGRYSQTEPAPGSSMDLTSEALSEPSLKWSPEPSQEASEASADTFESVWVDVVDELMHGANNPHSEIPALTPQQKAWLPLVRPVTFTKGFALLEAPNSFAQDAIQRLLHGVISQALAQRLGTSVTLAVSVRPPDQSPSPRAAGAPENPGIIRDHLRNGQQPNPTDPAPWPRPPILDGEAVFDDELPVRPGTTSFRDTHPTTSRSATTPPAADFVAGGPAAEQRPEMTVVGASEDEGSDAVGSLISAATPHRSRPADASATTPSPSASTPGSGTTLDTGAIPRSGRPAPLSTPAGTRAATPDAPTQRSGDLTSTTLNPKYTFESYVIGKYNRFATAAALAVSEQPASSYNPLFLWGDSGLGKTHLLHAIGHYTQRLYPTMRVRYVSTEEFTNDFINSVRDDRKSAFKKRYRDTDLLLVDDIQFLEGKEGTQEEFFYTFESLHNTNKQIVISSDRPPKQLATLEDRLRTRFEWGLITDIQPPDMETRLAILRKKAQLENITVAPDVLELIAESVDRNIRELEGALIRVTAFSSLNQQQLDTELARAVLHDLVSSEPTVEITAPMIMRVTAEYFQTTVDELCGPKKQRTLAHARQAAMYLCRELTEMSLPKIGATFGGRDHTTVMYAEKKIRNQLSENRKIYDEIQELTSLVKSRARKEVKSRARKE